MTAMNFASMMRRMIFPVNRLKPSGLGIVGKVMVVTHSTA
jgi:hypothetical protein